MSELTAATETNPKPTRWPRALRSMAHRNFRLFWSGQIVSQLGTWMQIVAQGWVVYEITDSPLMLGVVSFAALIPVVPIGLLAGPISDRYPKQKIIILAEILLIFQALTMALLLWLNVLQVWHVILLSFVLGAAAALEQPARLALVIETVGKDDLSNAVALNSSSINIARIIGPSIAGVVLAVWGAAACFLVNGLSYSAVIISVLAMRLKEPKHLQTELPLTKSMLRGFDYAWKSISIRGLLIIVAISSFLTLPYIALLPVFARDVLQVGPQGLGFLMASVGVGAVLGAVIVALLEEGHRGKWLVTVNILGPAFLFLFTWSKIYAFSLIVILMVGATNAVRQILANSLLQITTSKQYHGRVMSLFNLLFNGMSRVGALGIGGLAEFIGSPIALGLSSLSSLIMGVLIYRYMPELARLR